MHICDACKKKHYLAGNCHIMQSLRDCFPDNSIVILHPWTEHRRVSARKSNTQWQLLLPLMTWTRWNCLFSHNHTPRTMEVTEIAQLKKKKKVKIHGSNESESTYLVTNFESVFKLKPTHSLAKRHLRATCHLFKTPAAKQNYTCPCITRHIVSLGQLGTLNQNSAGSRWKTWPEEQAVC